MSKIQAKFSITNKSEPKTYRLVVSSHGYWMVLDEECLQLGKDQSATGFTEEDINECQVFYSEFNPITTGWLYDLMKFEYEKTVKKLAHVVFGKHDVQIEKQ